MARDDCSFPDAEDIVWGGPYVAWDGERFVCHPEMLCVYRPDFGREMYREDPKECHEPRECEPPWKRRVRAVGQTRSERSQWRAEMARARKRQAAVPCLALFDENDR